jgi:3',5'-cyclic AMP phosphodiesterase CpdA
MPFSNDRRNLLKLAGVGGVVFASRLSAAAEPGTSAQKKKSAAGEDFFFLQLSDTHWGYSGVANPEGEVPLPAAIAQINQVAGTGTRPDFVVFTGDLTHTTDDVAVRRKRMTEFRGIVSGPRGLGDIPLHFIPGEHDAAPDAGAVYREFFGPSHHAFDHKGVHFVALDNVSDRTGALGPAQIDWLAADLRKHPRAERIVVFAHRPLFDLFPAWEWATPDGAKAIDVLLPHPNVTVFYGHIHQEHHHQTEHIAHHAARSLIFALPAPGSVPKKAPLAWDAAAQRTRIGYRNITLPAAPVSPPQLVEVPPAG